MNKSDKERLKKIISLWNALNEEIKKHTITQELLLNDQFAQWAVTTPVYNIGEQVYQLTPEFKAAIPRSCGAWYPDSGTVWYMTMRALTGR